MRLRSTSFRKLFNRLDNEDGAVLVIFALLLVVLLGFAAIAVDLSALFVERRHAQTAADVGVLSGAQFAGLDDPVADADAARQAVIDEVKAISASNLDANDWASCVDPGMPAEFSPVAGETPCISFKFGLTKIRVRVPDQAFQTFFAGVIGIDTLSAAAAAEVTAEQHQSGDILPFGVPLADASKTVACLADNPNGTLDCDGPDAGNYNQMAITQWGTGTAPPTPPRDNECSHTQAMLIDNTKYGIDHLLGLFADNPHDDKIICDDPIVGDAPGRIWTYPGLDAAALTTGLITGVGDDGSPDGRLLNAFGSTRDITSQSTTYALDDTPLWYFIGTGPSDVPPSCERSTFYDGGESDWDEDLWVEMGEDPLLDNLGDTSTHLEPNASFEHMARCLREYEDGVWDEGTGATGLPPYDGAGYSGDSFDGVLFSKHDHGDADIAKGIYDLQLSPRWGWSPIGVFGVGTSPFDILGFKPLFIQTLIAKCNALTCTWSWQAGEVPTAATIPPAGTLAFATSFQLPDSTLPQTVHDFGPASRFLTSYSLTK